MLVFAVFGETRFPKVIIVINLKIQCCDVIENNAHFPSKDAQGVIVTDLLDKFLLRFVKLIQITVNTLNIDGKKLILR